MEFTGVVTNSLGRLGTQNKGNVDEFFVGRI